MKYEIPSEAQMKLEHARQIELSIGRLNDYEFLFESIKKGNTQHVIPGGIRKRFQDWVESNIIIEQSNIQNYGK
jgi:hypothetical protein